MEGSVNGYNWEADGRKGRKKVEDEKMKKMAIGNIPVTFKHINVVKGLMGLLAIVSEVVAQILEHN